MVKCSLPALGSDLLQMPPILHNMFEPSKHNPKVTLSFVMPLKLSLDVIATILTLCEGAGTLQQTAHLPLVCVLDWGLPWAPRLWQLAGWSAT